GALGLLLVFLVLIKRVRHPVALAVVLAILAGTDLLFSVGANSGMCNVHSFYLLAAIYFLLEMQFRQSPANNPHQLLGIVAGLILVTRPTNVIFIPLAIAITATSWAEVSARIEKLLHMRFAAPFLIGAFLMCLPQMAYWQYAFGTPIKWS